MRGEQQANAQRSPLIGRVAIVTGGGRGLLVNNAGRGMKYISDAFLTEPTQFWEVEPETWRMVIDTNVNGPFLISRSAVPVMLKAGWGRIVNISMKRRLTVQDGNNK